MAHLTASEAKKLTEQIRSNVQELSTLVRNAHRGRIWEAMGYDHFSAWVEGELGWTNARGFQLLNIAHVSDELCEAVAMPEGFRLTDLQTREIIHRGRTEFMLGMMQQASPLPDENVKLLIEVLRPEPAPKDSEKVQAASERGTAEEPVFRVRGGVRNSKTGVVLSRSMGAQARDFPAPALLGKESAAEGLQVLLQARHDIQELLQEILNAALAEAAAESEKLKLSEAEQAERAEEITEKFAALTDDLNRSDLSQEEKVAKLNALIEEEGSAIGSR